MAKVRTKYPGCGRTTNRNMRGQVTGRTYDPAPEKKKRNLSAATGHMMMHKLIEHGIKLADNAWKKRKYTRTPLAAQFARMFAPNK